jgi:lipopolysaccharide export system permease protein
MKKTLFSKLLYDCVTFFLLALLSSSIIIWVFQAVNYLDIMIEDGRDYSIYFQYTLLNFPKIISKILPFALFFSFSFILAKYEQNNELLIFWVFGITKKQLIKFFLKFSILLTIFQILFTSFLVPTTQEMARDFIRNSDVNLFENFMKPRKFNDTIKGLTIYTSNKDKNGKMENIYLKKKNENGFQMTYAKEGYFKNLNILELYNGQTANFVNDKVTTFKFTKSDFNLSNLDTDIIKINKIQETSTFLLIDCVKKFINKNEKKNIIFSQNCSRNNLDNVYKELYKRFIVPLYIPILILISLLTINKSKENVNYSRYRLYIFLFGLFLIIFSETTLRFINAAYSHNIRISLIPIIIFFLIYKIFFSNNDANFKKNNI